MLVQGQCNRSFCDSLFMLKCKTQQHRCLCVCMCVSVCICVQSLIMLCNSYRMTGTSMHTHTQIRMRTSATNTQKKLVISPPYLFIDKYFSIYCILCSKFYNLYSSFMYICIVLLSTFNALGNIGMSAHAQTDGFFPRINCLCFHNKTQVVLLCLII